MTDNVFDNGTEELISTETLVGEGKKYKSTDDLAKAYSHASAAIKAREDELASLRLELNTRLTVQEQLAKSMITREPIRAPASEVQNPPLRDPAISQEDLDARILEVTSKANREKSLADNAEEVTQRLITIYGDTNKANQVVRQKASELGVSVDFLLASARQSPKAFYLQIGVDGVPSNQQRNSPSRSEVLSSFGGNTPGVKAVGSYEYYEDIRKTNPKQFFTPKIQNQLHKDASDGRYIAPSR